jgi:hypothetical protein
MSVDAFITTQMLSIAASNFTLGSSGTLSAYSTGYTANTGPGAGAYGGGGSFGGVYTREENGGSGSGGVSGRKSKKLITAN